MALNVSRICSAYKGHHVGRQSWCSKNTNEDNNNKHLFIWEIYRERKRESIILLLFHFANGINGQGWAKESQEPRAVSGFPRSVRVSASRVILCCFPQIISREMNQKWTATTLLTCAHMWYYLCKRQLHPLNHNACPCCVHLHIILCTSLGNYNVRKADVIIRV